MSITLITGTPGAGKTLYCVSELLPPLKKPTIATDSQGNEVEIHRKLYTNIRDLVQDHELIDESETHGLNGWHNWCKPGDFIVFDEVQHFWKPRANGSKVPDYIQALETHRHKGVDFVLLTQGPHLIDGNLRALVDRHLHVRRMGNAGFSIVYEWDHCSRSLLYSKAIDKKPFRFSKKAFQGYKSSELHTKQRRSLPGVLWIVALAVLVALYLVPSTFSRISTRATESTKTETAQASNADFKKAEMVNQTKAKAPARGFVDSENLAVARPQIDDLLMTGHIFAPAGTVLFQWVPYGVPRSSFTRADLARHGITVQVHDLCKVTVSDQFGRSREMGCSPGVVPFDPQQQQPPPSEKSSTA